ncbi:hypothetical protein QCA50_016649 [Cerrena zonata]|uniref:Carbohydrate kinase PfkB domain-containing protein n=1 Tax=Cerrena zonata TaxID=2478898 RepID=A0AAW0FQB3_9APHY
MPNTGRCLVRGSINIDEFFHVPTIVQPGETLSSTHYERRSGGKGANQAVAVAKAGASVTLIGAIGSDGDWVLNGLKQVGVDVGPVIVTHDEPTGRAIIQLTPEGENCIILHRGANYATVSSDSVTSTTFSHLLIQNEIPFSSTLAALAHAHQIDATTLFNPSPMPNIQQLRELPWDELDWLIVNQGEVLTLLKAFQSDRNINTAEREPVTLETPATWPSHPEIKAALLAIASIARTSCFLSEN